MDVSAGACCFFPSGFFVELEQEMKLEIFDVSLKKGSPNNLN